MCSRLSKKKDILPCYMDATQSYEGNETFETIPPSPSTVSSPSPSPSPPPLSSPTSSNSSDVFLADIAVERTSGRGRARGRGRGRGRPRGRGRGRAVLTLDNLVLPSSTTTGNSQVAIQDEFRRSPSPAEYMEIMGNDFHIWLKLELITS